VCADGAVGSCVPACSEALRGDLLRMNLNGEDSIVGRGSVKGLSVLRLRP
jgi:hypothetical protein